MAGISGHSMSVSIGGNTVAGSKSFSVSFSQATIDVTTRDENFQGSFVAGRRGATIDIDTLYIYNNVAKKVILDHVNAATAATVAVIVTMPDGGLFTGTGIVTSFNITGPDEAALTAKASIQITGALTASVS